MPKTIKKTSSTGPTVSLVPHSAITIGDFRIILFHDGGAWILHKEGEGMQTTTEKLAAAIEAFWKEEF
jgi:hypothetical protein